jgi:hypothetical protein
MSEPARLTADILAEVMSVNRREARAMRKWRNRRRYQRMYARGQR